MNLSRLAGIYVVAASILAVTLAGALLFGPYRAIERSDYMTYHVAAKIILAGDGDCLYDETCQAAVQQTLIGEEPTFEGGALPFNSPPWLAAVVAPLGWLPLPAGFAIFTLLGLAVLAIAAWLLTPATGWGRLLGPLLVLSAWPTVMAAIRGQSTLLVAGLLGLSVGLARYRSGLALGLAALKPTLVPLWALWQLLGRHWRAVGTAAAVGLALVGISLVVVGPKALVAYPGYLLDVAGTGAIGVHVDEMVNWRGAADRLGLGGWFVSSGTVVTLALLAFVWFRSANRQLTAGAAFLATPLVIPHANQHEAVLGALGILLVVSAAGPMRVRLAAAAVALHAVLWVGPAVTAQAAAWALFAALMGSLVVACALAAQMPSGTSVRWPVHPGTD